MHGSSCILLTAIGAASGQELFLSSKAQTQSWAGTLNYGSYASNVPLNVTVDASGIASFDWTYDHDASGTPCRAQSESGIKWVLDGKSLTAHGTGKDPSYYGFEGILSDDGKSITGTVLDADQKGRVGTWQVSLDAERKPPQCSPPPTAPKIWPVPSDYSFGSTTLKVAQSKDFFQGPSTEVLTAAYERYQQLSFPHRVESGDATGSLTSLKIEVDSLDESHPQVEADESYSLEVPEAGGAAILSAKTVWGALRGLETFSQLLTFDFDAAGYTLPQAPWSIKDAPRFPHRGLMIDTSRHFLTLEAIRSIIDSLPYAKLNVLHWHMSDSQSFPMESKKRPNLWKGAYSEQERYLQTDIADIVEYARMRGVRVMVEFDMPGHAASWCSGYPEVCPSSSCTQPLNVASNKTFELIEDLLMEMTGGVPSKPGKPAPGLFKDNFIHLGGDEVNTDCWTKTPSVAKWLQDQGMTADQGYAYFVKRAADIAIAQGHRPVQWSEVYDHFKTQLAKETVVHIWKGVTNVTEVVANGYQVILNVG